MYSRRGSQPQCYVPPLRVLCRGAQGCAMAISGLLGMNGKGNTPEIRINPSISTSASLIWDGNKVFGIDRQRYNSG